MFDVLSSKRNAPYLFMAPVILFGVLMFLGPLTFAAYISLTDWDGVSSPNWVGLDNYAYLIGRDRFFFTSIWNTLYFAAGSVIIGVPAALIAAAMISQSRYQSFWRTVYWLPMITNIVAVAYIWWYILNDTSGLLNRTLDLFGLPGPNWLTNPSISMFSVIMVASWMSVGQNILVFLSGLGEIDESYYEAAKLDGAGPLQLFWHVTIPLLRPTILFVLITSLISALSSFVLMMILADGGPARSTTVTGLYMYNMAFTDLRLGRASAAAYILFGIILVISLIQLRLLRRGGVEAH
ncbi:carbohydrate ABC transporter permease [Sphingomonas sp. RB1R13]|uniref:carbohydrate ABC transporter permease n=1 Tax=Sphingomonas sp. RB1R13 TaxID=3096159 RepID=UPI002FCBC35D